jgi:hypothetical protein
MKGRAAIRVGERLGKVRWAGRRAGVHGRTAGAEERWAVAAVAVSDNTVAMAEVAAAVEAATT